MNELIINLYKYFSKFVSKDVLRKMFIQPIESMKTGYQEIEAEILAGTDEFVIPDFDTYVVSINESFLSERMKNSKDFVLFIEYGEMDVDHETVKGVKQSLSIAVAHNFSTTNNDNLNEILLMNKCLEILDQIIAHMQSEQDSLDFCQNAELITFPAAYKVIDPAAFYNCGGWAAQFKNSHTIL